LFSTRGEGGDGVGNTGVAEIGQAPGAKHEEWYFTFGKLGFGSIIVGAGADVTGFNVFLNEVAGSDHAFTVNTKVIGVVGAIIVQAEDIATECGLEWESVVGCTGQGNGVGGFAAVNECSTHFDQLIPGCRWGFNHVGIVEEGCVFNVVRNTNQLAVKGPGLEGEGVELVCFVAKVNGGKQSRFVETTQAIMSEHNNVGAFTCRGSDRELVINVGDVLDDEANAVFFLEGVD
jgi:hypothetical protein